MHKIPVPLQKNHTSFVLVSSPSTAVPRDRIRRVAVESILLKFKYDWRFGIGGQSEEQDYWLGQRGNGQYRQNVGIEE